MEEYFIKRRTEKSTNSSHSDFSKCSASVDHEPASVYMAMITWLLLITYISGAEPSLSNDIFSTEPRSRRKFKIERDSKNGTRLFNVPTLHALKLDYYVDWYSSAVLLYIYVYRDGRCEFADGYKRMTIIYLLLFFIYWIKIIILNLRDCC